MDSRQTIEKGSCVNKRGNGEKERSPVITPRHLAVLTYSSGVYFSYLQQGGREREIEKRAADEISTCVCENECHCSSARNTVTLLSGTVINVNGANASSALRARDARKRKFHRAVVFFLGPFSRRRTLSLLFRVLVRSDFGLLTRISGRVFSFSAAL